MLYVFNNLKAEDHTMEENIMVESKNIDIFQITSFNLYIYLQKTLQVSKAPVQNLLESRKLNCWSLTGNHM